VLVTITLRTLQGFPMNSRTREVLRILDGLDSITIGAEIGVWKGQLSKGLLKNIPDLTLVMVDPWCENHLLTMERSTRDTSIQQARTEALLRVEFARDRAIILDMVSHKAAEYVDDRSLDFVFIDACHEYCHVLMDICSWAPKVRPGGIVSGHDYNTERERKGVENWGVKKAVDDYVAVNGCDLHSNGIFWWFCRE